MAVCVEGPFTSSMRLWFQGWTAVAVPTIDALEEQRRSNASGPGRWSRLVQGGIEVNHAIVDMLWFEAARLTATCSSETAGPIQIQVGALTH